MRSKYEIKADKELKEQGWATDYKIRPTMVPRGYTVDYFGLFDLLAFDGQTLRLIAIKGHEGVPSILRRGIEGFNVNKIIKEIWVFKENKLVKREIIL